MKLEAYINSEYIDRFLSYDNPYANNTYQRVILFPNTYSLEIHIFTTYFKQRNILRRPYIIYLIVTKCLIVRNYHNDNLFLVN